MSNFKFVVFTDPLPGQDDEYNDWYDTVHLPEVTAVPGVVGAKRYKAVALPDREVTHGYLAIYDFQGDGQAIVEEIQRRASRGEFRMSPALNRDTAHTMLYECISD